jgi:D-lactate dehydrogenase (cytochrome)
MSTHRIVARPPKGAARAPDRITDAGRLSSVSEDAAHVRGRASALVVPTTEAEIADVLRSSRTVLPIGAQSSLTGGATPYGDVVLSTAALRRIGDLGTDRVTVQAGVSLAELDAALAAAGCYYPAGPTFSGAFVGGTVATNAAGPATFKYGSTRRWVEAITVVLPTGDVLEIERGRVHAHEDGFFEICLDGGPVRVPVPRYTMPTVPKVSAGYFAAPGMDLIDLFIGAEGTLGVVVNVSLRIVSPRPAWCLAFVPFAERNAAVSCVRHLRDAARETWRTGDPSGIDVSAIEHLDGRCLELAREDGIDRKTGVTWPDGTVTALLITLELPTMTSALAYDQISNASEAATVDTPLGRFVRMLDAAGTSGDVLLAVPGDHARMTQLLALREELPASVNGRIGRAKQTIDARIEKTAGDLIVPFEHIEEFLSCCDREFEKRRLDAAVWGHISDGNLHPNVLPRSFADVEAGRMAILDLGREVIRLGGSPLAEHGVGRNLGKQRLLEELFGRRGVEEMRAVKRALDPEWKLAPGVLFPQP